MGNYTIFGGLEDPRRGRQARNVPKILDLKSTSEQIFSKNCRWVPLIQQVSSKPGLWRFTTETPQEQEQRPEEFLHEQWRRRRHQETAEQREYRLTLRRQRRPQGQRNKGTEACNIRGKMKACFLAYEKDVCILDLRISHVTWLVMIKKPIESTLQESKFHCPCWCC